MNNFFSNFDKVLYNFEYNNIQKNVIMTNFTRNIQVKFDDTNKNLEYNRYYISDGEKPDMMSYKLYDSPYKHWSFYLLNPELKNGWPLSDNEVDKYISNLYDGLSFIVDKNESIYSLLLEEDDDIENIDIYVRSSVTYVKVLSNIRGFDAKRRAIIVNYNDTIANRIEARGRIFFKPNDNYAKRFETTDPEKYDRLLNQWTNEEIINDDGYYELYISKVSSSLLSNAIYEFDDISYRDGIINSEESTTSPNSITFSENIIRENEKNKFIKIVPESTMSIVEKEYLKLLKDATT